MSLHPKADAYIQSLQGPIPDFLKNLKQQGQQDQIPIISDEVGQMLQMLCALQQPKSILELGTGIGYSTHWMLLGSPHAAITSVDANQNRIDLSATFLQQSGGLEQVRLVCAWVETFLEKNSQSYDLIFIDSTKKDYPMLLDQCYHALAINGLLVADNIFYQGKFNSYVSNEDCIHPIQ